MSATQLLAWSATLSAGGQDAEALKAALQAKNIPLTDLEQIEAFDQQRQALQPALQAAKLVQAAENGVMDGPDGALNLLEDPELAAIDQAILDAKRSSHLYGPAELASLEAHQKTLLDTRDQRRQALDAAVAKASGSKFRDTAAMIRGTFQANSLVGLDEQALLLRMNRGGQLPLEEWMYACTKGLDTNVPEFEKRLAGRSPQEIAAAGAQFKKRYLAEYPELATIDDDRVVAHLIDSETDGLDRLRLKKAALGDATLVFNPKDTNLLGRTRTEQAAEALEIRRQSLRLDRETTQSGWLHEAANWGQAGERGTMNAAVMTESHQVETDAWIRKHTEGLQDGDPALWAQLDERMGLQSSMNGVENQQKTAIASRAKADIADLEQALELEAPADVTAVLQNLLAGSERHLAAFERNA